MASLQYRSTGRIRYNLNAIALQDIWNPEDDGASLSSFKTKTKLQSLTAVQNIVITKRQEHITQYHVIKFQTSETRKIIDGAGNTSGLLRLWPV